MAKILRIFDVSNYIHAGAVNNAVVSCGIRESNGYYAANTMPVGGVNFLLNTLFEFQDDNTDLVYTFDSNYYLKREMHSALFPQSSGYKGTRRERDDSIYAQRALAFDILQQLNVTTLMLDGYESDDLIYSIIQRYYDDYAQIIVHVRDSDMTFIVDEKVSIAPVGERGKHINLSNYCDVAKSGYVMPYNISTLDKLLKGDPKDNIPPIAHEHAKLILDFIMPESYSLCGELHLLRAWVSQATNNDAIVLGTLDLVCPMLVPEDYELDLVCAKLEESLYIFYMCELGNKYAKHLRSQCKHSVQGENTIRKHVDKFNEGRW